MKFGIRKPSIKRSIKARTTGRLKREIKKAIIPGYGKKGIGILHPKKALYNKIYRKTSVSFWSLLSDFIDEFESEKIETKKQNPINENYFRPQSLENDFEFSVDDTIEPIDEFEFYTDSPNPKFHRSHEEKKSKLDFFSKYYNQNSDLDRLELKLIELYKNGNLEKNRNMKIDLYNRALGCYEEIKTFCFSYGDGGRIYFEDMWEHCHNSSDPDFSYGQTIIDKRDALIVERDTYIPLIISKISKNNGILQKNIYELLPEIKKSTLQKLIRELEKDGLIERTKKSGTYELKTVYQKWYDRLI